MTKIIGLSGKKQSGKTTTANWIIGQQMVNMDMVSWVRIDRLGRLVVPSVVNDEVVEGIFDPQSHDPNVEMLLAQYIWPVVKLYSFADILKMAAAAIFGLQPEQVNGTNAQKDAPTKYKWSMFKGFLLPKTQKQYAKEIAANDNMSSRHILQVMGTDIFRRIYGNVWVDACLKNIKDDGPELAIVTDCRFPNEVEGIQKAGGKVIRFLRAPFAGQDEHESETALDNYTGFDHIFDNRELSIAEQNEQTNRLLTAWKCNTWDWQTQSETQSVTPHPQDRQGYAPGFVDTVENDPR